MIDRRGEKKPEQIVAKPEQAVKDSPEAKGAWDDVTYMVVLAQGPTGQIMVLGRAVGLREDGETFVADWIFPPLWQEGFRWEPEVKKRLDTFLNCDCTISGPCSIHKMYIPQWMQADTQRLNLLAAAPVPRALETLTKAEQARAKSKPNLVIPR